METVEDLLKNNRYQEALSECSKNNMLYLGMILGKILRVYPVVQDPLDPVKLTRVKLLCNWCSSREITALWSKMSQGNGRWNSIQLVVDGEVDYYVIINAPELGVEYDKKKSIVFRMEPEMYKNPQWGEWSNPISENFLKICKHEEGEYNNNEWHLSKTYCELVNELANELNSGIKTGILSTVLSEKYTDPGHIKRIDFVKFLEKKGQSIDVYGSNRWRYKDYKGPLPYHNKDNAIFPYKYTFNVENKSINNYYTEKLIDGILGECLTFYSGCPNIKKYIDERAYVYLDLSNFQKDLETIQKAIKEDWYTQRLPYIKQAKKKILNELQFFPRIEKIICESILSSSGNHSDV